jgi:hypothetical protein
MMDSLCFVGTDIATFFLYEPTALQHRAQSPWCWFADYGADADQTNLAELTVPELSDGRLVEIDTATPGWMDGRLMWVGSDGGYCFRCTTGPLTFDEAAREYPETRARYGPQVIHVTQERLLLDGGYVIPHAGADQSPAAVALAVEKQLAVWLELPNGTYQVTAHYLRTAEDEEDEPDDEPDDAPTIVLTFERLT